ncbi:immunity 26/phosphotriesterase HocA family protein [Halobacillus yeomjeoni]|uniref:Imm26 family immunity protein n=1 Tax=Halobacillus yeomjeoni TaxID=311194 RepID=UPI001CD67DF8|nr:Imm26 family immunity protein [Halobacillus yeomjeoni]MCA0984274.1 immunity 26/phosphotriesterase HocA family protein [Halobacillus yeomjeoni]
MPKRQRIKTGDVLAIPLPDDTFAFGKIFNDAGIGIYKYIGKDYNDLPQKEEFQFIVGVYDDVVKSGEWPKVDYRPFEDEESAWSPPSCIFDVISKGSSIYHKGEIYDSTEDECEGLEVAAIWEGHAIIKRIMGDESWREF